MANAVDGIASPEESDALQAQLLDDLHALDRLAETYDLAASRRAYVQLLLFTERFDLSWLVLNGAA